MISPSFEVLTETLAQAINDRSLGPVLPHLTDNVQLVSAAADEPLSGRHQVTNHLQRFLEDLASRDPINFVAVPGHCAGADGSDHPCAVVFDGFRKAMLLCPEPDAEGGLGVLRIVTDSDAVRAATPATQPSFPEDTHMPSMD